MKKIFVFLLFVNICFAQTEDTINVSFNPDYLPKGDKILVSFTPNYIPPFPTEDTILVSFTLNYIPPPPTESQILVSFTPDYIPPPPTEDTILVSFTPNYVPPAPAEGNILVSFTPDYQPPLLTEGNIVVTFTPDYYVISKSTDGIVNLTYKQATLLGETTSPYIIIVPTTTTEAVVAISSANADGFGVFSKLYDLGPEGTVFVPTATLTFTYSEPPFNETLLDIYRWNTDIGWQKLTAIERDTANNWIKVELGDIASIFALLYKIPDTTPPVTELKVLGDYFVSADPIGNDYSNGASTQNYISIRSSFCLTAYDPVINGVSSGVDYTEFSIDDGIIWNVYKGTFTLTQYISTETAEGEHRIFYRSRDLRGNIEEEKTFVCLVDVEPPVSELKPEGTKQIEYNNKLFVSGDTRFYLEANDKSPLYSPFEKGGNSGVKKIEYWIDEEEYQWRTVVDTSQPLNVGVPEDLPSEYFAEGSHKIGYRSIDNVNNVEATTVQEIYCDKSPPEISINSPKAGEVYIAKKSTITINFVISDNSDPEPETSAYLFNEEKSSKIFVSNGEQIEPLSIEAGFWTLTVEATDWLGHSASTTTGAFKVIHDILPPRTEIATGEPKYITETSTFIARETQFSLSAVDDLIEVEDGIGLGVKETRYSINQETFTVYTSSFTLSEEGENTIRYYSLDVFGNVEEIKTLSVIADFSAPETIVSVSEPVYGNYITSHSSITLITEDKGVIPSGVKETKYSINQLPFSIYDLPFTISGDEGIYILNYYSIDNVLNTELTKSVTYYLDNTPPETALNIGAPQYEEGRKIYISEETEITLSAIDPVIEEVASGLQYTEYRIDGGGWQKYLIPFTLVEGIRLVEYRSIDNVENTEQIKSITLYVDETPPESNLIAGQPRYQSGDNLYVTPMTTYTLTTVDPVAAEVTSGVDYAEYKVDAAAWSKKESPVMNYQLPVTLAEGERVIYYRGTDNVENREADKSLTVLVDDTAPETTLAIRQPKYLVIGSTYITSSSEVTLSATDPISNGVASGVAFTEYRILSSTGVYREWTEYEAFKIIGPDGIYTIEYRSADNVTNREDIKTQVLLLDNTNPETIISAGIPQYISGDKIYITPQTPVELSATDPVINDVASGVQYTQYRIDSSDWITYTDKIYLQEGIRTVEYRSNDNLGNLEEIRTQIYYVDETPPVTSLAIEGIKYVKTDGIYVTSHTTFTLTAEDPIVEEVASGVKEIKYRILSSTGVYENWKLYQEENPPVSPFDKRGIEILGPDGIYTIEYYSVDNVENTEEVKTITVKLDNTAPKTAISAGEPQYISEGKIYISLQTQIELSSVDPVVNGVAVGVEAIKYRIDGAGWQVYTGTFTLAEGIRTVEYYAYDYLKNIKEISEQIYYVDGTAPESSLTVSNPKVRWFGKEIISAKTALSINVTDPVVKGAASGVKSTKWKVDSGEWNIYTGTFTLTEGEHLLKYYSVDNVSNSEEFKSRQFTVTAFLDYEITGSSRVEAAGQSRVNGNIISDALKVAGKGRVKGNIRLRGKSAEDGDDDDDDGDEDDDDDDGMGISGNGEVQGNILISGNNIFKISGKGNVKGNIASNGEIKVTGKGKVEGDVRAGTVTVKGNGEITGEITEGSVIEDVVNIPYIPFDIKAEGEKLIGDNDNNKIPGEYLDEGELEVEEGQSLVLSSGSYYFNSMEIKGELKTAGPVIIYCEGEIEIDEGAFVNSAGVWKDLLIIAGRNQDEDDDDDEIEIEGNFTGVILAPDRSLELSGSAVIMESFLWAEVIKFEGRSTVNPEEGGIAILSAGRHKRKLAPAFELKEVYSYPNPAKKTNPTIHIDCGVSNARIELKIYNIAGELVFEKDISNYYDPDKNAYEYIWNCPRKASGVYIYLIKASRDGKTLKRTGKIGLIK